MRKTAALFAVIATLTGCAGSQPRKEDAQQARCQEQPQWTTTNPAGESLGIYVCFGERSQLLYAVRVLPKPVPTPAAASAASAAPAPKSAIHKPSSKKPAQLPTLGGTAK